MSGDLKMSSPNVKFVRNELAFVMPQYKLIRDALSGETTVKAARDAYLPKPLGCSDGELGGDEVQGTIWDRQGRYVVVGHTTGCGQFELRSLCCTYDVRVADEVMDDKVVNRQQWQEAWK